MSGSTLGSLPCQVTPTLGAALCHTQGKEASFIRVIPGGLDHKAPKTVGIHPFYPVVCETASRVVHPMSSQQHGVEAQIFCVFCGVLHVFQLVVALARAGRL